MMEERFIVGRMLGDMPDPVDTQRLMSEDLQRLARFFRGTF